MQDGEKKCVVRGEGDGEDERPSVSARGGEEEEEEESDSVKEKTSSRIQNSTSPTRRPFVLPLSADCSLRRG